MNRRLQIARWGAGVAAAGLAAIAIGAAAPPAAVATPEEDCQAVRDRDHQIWLDLIANLPPGAPIPPEPINPCIPAGPETTTTAPAPLPGQGGQTGTSGSGPQVGANAPTLMPRYNGTDIVPVPGLPAPPQTRGGNPTDQRESGASTAPNATVTGSPAPTTTSARPADQTPSSTPAPAAPANQISGQHEADPSATADNSGSDSNVIELLLIAAAALAAAAGIRRPRSARTPEALLSQVVGTVAEPLTALSPGGHLVVEVPKPDGGHITYVLMNDPDSPTDHAMSTTAPPGGRLQIDGNGTVSVIDATNTIIGTVAPAWAYDKTGAPVPTWYEIRDGRLYQIIRPGPDTRWPVLGDDNITAGKRTNTPAKQTRSDWTTDQDTDDRYLSGPQLSEITQNAGASPWPTTAEAEAERRADNNNLARAANSNQDPTSPTPAEADNNLARAANSNQDPTSPTPAEVEAEERADNNNLARAANSNQDPTSPTPAEVEAEERADNNNLARAANSNQDPTSPAPGGPSDDGLGGDEFKLDVNGAILSGGLEAFNRLTDEAAAASKPGRHAAHAAEAAKAARALSGMGRAVPWLGNATSVASGIKALINGASIPETAGATAGTIIGAWGGAKAGASGGAIVGAMFGGPVGAGIVGFIGGVAGAVVGAGAGQLAGHAAGAAAREVVPR